jgi:hypothetical protein
MVAVSDALFSLFVKNEYHYGNLKKLKKYIFFLKNEIMIAKIAIYGNMYRINFIIFIKK